MRNRILAAALTTAALAIGPLAHAQAVPSPTSTAAPTDASAPVAQPGGDDTADQIAAWLKAPPAAAPSGPSMHAEASDRQIHGEVGVMVSNRGYAGYGAASMPLGDASELDVAVGGGHEKLPGGRSINPRSLSIGLYLDGGDVARWLSKDKCGVQHAVPLRGDPVVYADGSCGKPGANGQAPPSGS